MISRVVRSLLERRSAVLLLGSALHLVFSLLAYSLAGHDGFGAFLLLFAMLLAGANAGILYLEYRNGLFRVFLQLPVNRNALAAAFWAMAVAVPTVWALGLTLIVWLATSAGDRVGWFFVPMAVALAFLCSSISFCVDSLENSRRKFGGESAPRRAQVALGALVVVAGFAGVYFFWRLFGFLLSMEFWQLRQLLVVLTIGAGASALGFARTQPAAEGMDQDVRVKIQHWPAKRPPCSRCRHG